MTVGSKSETLSTAVEVPHPGRLPGRVAVGHAPLALARGR